MGDAAEQFGVDVRNRIFVLPGIDLDFEATPEFEVPPARCVSRRDSQVDPDDWPEQLVTPGASV